MFIASASGVSLIGLIFVNTCPWNAHCMPMMLRETLLPDLCLLTVDAEGTRLSVPITVNMCLTCTILQDPHVGARGVTGKVALNRTMGGGYQQPTYAPGASYAPKISMGRPSTVGPVVRGASQNFSIKAAANGDYINNFGNGDIVCNREFFTMTEDRPIVKEVSCFPHLSILPAPVPGHAL